MEWLNYEPLAFVSEAAGLRIDEVAFPPAVIILYVLPCFVGVDGLGECLVGRKWATKKWRGNHVLSQVNYVFCMLLAYPLSLLFRLLPTSAPSLRNLVAGLVGLAFGVFCFRLCVGSVRVACARLFSKTPTHRLISLNSYVLHVFVLAGGCYFFIAIDPEAKHLHRCVCCVCVCVVCVLCVCVCVVCVCVCVCVCVVCVCVCVVCVCVCVCVCVVCVCVCVCVCCVCVCVLCVCVCVCVCVLCVCVCVCVCV
jgi:hypothetical protein